MKVQFTSLGNDLFAEFPCTCCNINYAGTALKDSKTIIKLTGYNDANFFDSVNAKPSERTCVCGKKYSVQWFRDGVKVIECLFLKQEDIYQLHKDVVFGNIKTLKETQRPIVT